VVPVVPPPGLALPTGAVLFSNGEVKDAAGNVIGTVPEMPGMDAEGQPTTLAGARSDGSLPEGARILSDGQVVDRNGQLIGHVQFT